MSEFLKTLTLTPSLSSIVSTWAHPSTLIQRRLSVFSLQPELLAWPLHAFAPAWMITDTEKNTALFIFLFRTIVALQYIYSIRSLLIPLTPIEGNFQGDLRWTSVALCMADPHVELLLTPRWWGWGEGDFQTAECMTIICLKLTDNHLYCKHSVTLPFYD